MISILSQTKYDGWSNDGCQVEFEFSALDNISKSFVVGKTETFVLTFKNGLVLLVKSPMFRRREKCCSRPVNT